ncbi:MAG: hypothetical protein IKS41_07275 [Alphaproteobacteria bacterium]|nr:hypothetical protein [Alphaproteobacteria bacterium]
MIRLFQHKFFFIKLKYLALCGLGLMLTACGEAPTLPNQQNSYSDCWPCKVYETAFDCIQKSMSTLVDLTAKNALTLLGLCLLFWLLFHVGKFLVTIRVPNMRKFVFPITTTLFKAIVVAGLLYKPEGSEHCYLVDFAGDIISPIMEFFANVARLILDSNFVVKEATQAASTSSLASVDTNTIFKGSARTFLDIIYRIYVALKLGMSLGFTLWRQHDAAGWLFGILIMCMFWVTLVTMPISLLDSIVRIMASVIVAPFALVGWVFPPTKWMLGRLWGVFFGAGLNLIFIAFYIALTVYVVVVFAEKTYPGILGNATQQNDPDLVDLVKTFSPGLIGFFVLILCMNKLGAYIFKFANQLGGESVEGSFIRAFQGFKKLAIAAGKMAIAVAVSSPTVAMEAVRDTKNVAKEIAQNNASDGG